MPGVREASHNAITLREISEFEELLPELSEAELKRKARGKLGQMESARMFPTRSSYRGPWSSGQKCPMRNSPHVAIRKLVPKALAWVDGSRHHPNVSKRCHSLCCPLHHCRKLQSCSSWLTLLLFPKWPTGRRMEPEPQAKVFRMLLPQLERNPLAFSK